MFLHGIVNNGELVQCIAAVADEARTHSKRSSLIGLVLRSPKE
jgi:hypothetical protein